MEHLDFTLKVVSPAFVGGAMIDTDPSTGLRDSNRKKPRRIYTGPEGDGLRIPSLKGILRFWFRSQYGLFNTVTRYKELQKAESEVFGDSDKIGQGLRLLPTYIPEWKPLAIGKVEGHQQGIQQMNASPSMGYLGYGPLNYSPELRISSHNRSSMREAIPPGTEFGFRAIGNKPQIEELKRCLLLLHLFGGIGARSRRAWGSLALADSSETILPDNNGQSIAEWIGACLANVWSAEEGRSKSPEHRYSAFCRDTEVHLINDPQNDFGRIMNSFHRRFVHMRMTNANQPDEAHDIVKEDVALERRDARNGSPDISGLPKRLTFGLPYNPNSRQHNWSIDYKGYYKEEGKTKEIDRRSSPLLLKVLEGPNGKLYPIILLLKAHFFGRPDVEVGKDPTGNHFPVTEWAAIQEFINYKPTIKIDLPH